MSDRARMMYVLKRLLSKQDEFEENEPNAQFTFEVFNENNINLRFATDTGGAAEIHIYLVDLAEDMSAPTLTVALDRVIARLQKAALEASW